MKRLIFFYTLLSAPLLAIPTPSIDFSAIAADPDRLEITNRVLIRIQGEPISVRDIVRRMDLLFVRQYPEFVEQPAIRYQFYRENWRAFLQAAIDERLILLDAEQRKVSVTEGEVRERLQESLGPDLVLNLEKLNLTLDEATEMTRVDLIVSKMQGGLVHAKALAGVHPKSIKARYEKMCQEHPPLETYVYQVLSFKGEEGDALASAQEALKLLVEEKGSLEELAKRFSSSCHISNAYTRTTQDISMAHKSVLEKLKAGEFSAPVVKRDQAYIFYLKSFEHPEPTPFAELAGKIKQELIQELIAQYDQEYRMQLRKKYGITEQFLSELIPTTTEPFALR